MNVDSTDKLTPEGDSTGSLDAAAETFSRLLDPDAGTPDREEHDDEAQTADADEAEALEPDAEGETPDEPDTDADPDAEAEGEDDGEGDEEPDEEGTDDADEGSAKPVDLTAKVTVTVDGKTEEVTIAELQAGYQRQSDYSRKTQEVAEARRVVEAETEAVRTERGQYAQLLTALAAQLDAEGENQPDWDALKATDPTEYLLKRAEWQEKAERRRAIAEEQGRLSEQSQAEAVRAHNEAVKAARVKLVEAVPAWRDPKVFERDSKAIKDFGQTLGFSAEELQGASDHRAILTLYKAMRFDRLEAKRQAGRPATPRGPTPKPLAAGTSNKPPRAALERTNAMKRLRSTGDVNDAAKVFESLI